MDTSKLMIEGNAVYELDLECMLTKGELCDNISNRIKSNDLEVAEKVESGE